MSLDVRAAREFVLRNARLLDRRRFLFLFERGTAASVFAALLPYRNDDGGFSHALEPDLRGLASQPVPVEHALHVLDEIDLFDRDVVEAACGWLLAVSTSEGGVPFVLESVADGPHASWWEANGVASLNPTAGIAGLLHKHRFEHTWLERATAYCWEALTTGLEKVGPDDAVSVLEFLEHVPDRRKAERELERLGARIISSLVALDPDASGYVKSPLEFARHPDRLARTLFDDATIEQHLDALIAKQQDDGGWPITWEPPSPAAVYEWRAFMTVMWLDVLASYGWI